MPTAMSQGLKLIAFDDEDLAVVSAHLQDALVRVGDMAHLGAERRFALVCSRFDWSGASGARPRRVRCGLHFDNVRRVSVTKLRRDAPEAVLNLLAIRFEPGETPAGAVVLAFSAGVAIRLECDCLEAAMSDIGESWKVALAPGHKIDTA